jgi:hypothetical protein
MQIQAEIDGETFEIVVTGFDAGAPAHMAGLPEDCCPATPPSCEWYAVKGGTEYSSAWFCPSEVARVDELVIEACWGDALSKWKDGDV